MRYKINIQCLYIYRYQILFVLFLLNVALFWPGIPVPDSQTQYSEALAGVYSDHHPAMMAFVWRHINMILPGFGSMYLIQMSFLYIGLYLILKTAESFIDFKKTPWLLCLIFLIPWWPQVLLYAIQIQKDNHFTFGFLAVAGALAFYTVKEKPIPIFYVILLIFTLIYGTAVKYQAQFCLPIFSIWLGFLLSRRKSILIKLGTSLLTTLEIYASIYSINSALIPESKKSNSWQYVKLFDLAAISIEIKEDLIPAFNKLPSYNFDELKQRFQPNVIDPYVFGQDPILTKQTTSEQQEELWSIWFNAVKQHPFIYIKHRLTNLSYCLTVRVGYSHVDRVLSKILTPNTQVYAVVRGVIDVIGYMFVSQLPIFILGLLYLIISLVYWRQSKLAPIVFGFTFPAFLLIGLLSVMSMAGTPRYTFFSLVLVHACHLFAIGLLTEIRNKREEYKA